MIYVKLKISLYHFFKNITLNAQTVSQIRVYSLFLRKFFRFNYELLWSERDQTAFNAFPNFFTEQECLPFLIKEQNKHKYYVNPTHIPNLFLDLLQFDPLCITEDQIENDNRQNHKSQLKPQRPTKIPIHYREKLNKLLIELEKHNIIKQIGSTPEEKQNIGTTFLNPLIIIPKGDTIKIVLDARHLNSYTNQTFESCPIEQ